MDGGAVAAMDGAVPAAGWRGREHSSLKAAFPGGRRAVLRQDAAGG